MNLRQLLSGRKVQTPHGVWVWEGCDYTDHQVKLYKLTDVRKRVPNYAVVIVELPSGSGYSIVLCPGKPHASHILIAKVEGLDLHKTLLELFESRYHSPIERLIQPGPLFYEISDTEEQAC